MSTISAVETGIYLYGITDAHDDLAVAMPGNEGGAVETIVADGIAAVVTRVSHHTIRPSEPTWQSITSFCTSWFSGRPCFPAPSAPWPPAKINCWTSFAPTATNYGGELAMLRGKAEMSLGVYWNTSNIFEFFVANNQELKAMRDRVFRPGREPPMEERLELGKLFESLLGQCRERHTQQVIDTLSPCCAEIRAVDPGQEQMIMKLVCLVHKDQQQRFEDGVQEAAQKFDDHYTFKYSGPWAPFDFVDISLNLS